MELCSGGIVGMGETWEQRVELAYDLASLDPDEVPLNFLNPRPGTPLEQRELVEPLEALKAIALFRLVLPRATLRYAGGREVTLRELQALGLVSGINALIVGNYLTTLGRSVEDDLRMLDDLRMPLRPLAEAL
jgi:biotin synthase